MNVPEFSNHGVTPGVKQETTNKGSCEECLGEIASVEHMKPQY